MIISSYCNSFVNISSFKHNTSTIVFVSLPSKILVLVDLNLHNQKDVRLIAFCRQSNVTKNWYLHSPT